MNYNPQIIAVSKTFKESDIKPLLEFGHNNFGENKVQEALKKWPSLKINYPNVKLHMLGKLQSNKVKYAVEIFDYIHSIDNLKLADKLANEIYKKKKDIKLFIQINLENEIQKSGINQNELESFYKNCINLNLNVIGIMCLPPENKPSLPYFKKIEELNNRLGLKEISMGMTNDYLDALNHKSTFLRIGSGIFGSRTSCL